MLLQQGSALSTLDKVKNENGIGRDQIEVEFCEVFLSKPGKKGKSHSKKQ
jgi:hypothetical protein